MSTYENQTGRLAPQSLLKQRYLIVGTAGRGGMSAVYQAIDTQGGGRRVAVKEMSQGHLSETELVDAAVRFQREANLLGSLHHPNLPRIYDAFNERGRFYLVMDYIDGKTLLQLLKEERGHTLPVPQVINYAGQLCDVLQYLHTHNPPIIFRDLKPTNVMVTESGRVFLIDFGIARFFKEGQAQDTVLLGSPGYAPPEQHGGAQTSPRSDLYALGATLHCCLTGQDPYNAPDRFSFAPVRRYNPLVPNELDQLIQRLLALDERQRPASALEVQQALTYMSQNASSDTMQVGPGSASAPTQYTMPAPPALAAAPASTQGPLILPTVGVAPPASGANADRAAGTVYAVPHLPPQATQRGPQPARPPVRRLPVWTPGFVLLFGLLLILTIAGSVLAFNVPNPYGANNLAGLDHAVEAGLSILAVIVALVMIAFARSIASIGAILLSTVAMLVAGFAFLVQTLRDIQPSIAIFTQIDVNQFLTIGLAAAGVASLLWLLRPFTIVDRILLLFMFGAVIACAIVQYSAGDGDVTKHMLLLVALIALIQGILTAGQMERKRVAH